MAGGGYMLGFDASGNIKEMDGPGLESAEAEEAIRRFEAIVADARTWREVNELEALRR